MRSHHCWSKWGQTLWVKMRSNNCRSNSRQTIKDKRHPTSQVKMTSNYCRPKWGKTIVSQNGVKLNKSKWGQFSAGQNEVKLHRSKWGHTLYKGQNKVQLTMVKMKSRSRYMSKWGQTDSKVKIRSSQDLGSTQCTTARLMTLAH